jgi:hypothetical protein
LIALRFGFNDLSIPLVADSGLQEPFAGCLSSLFRAKDRTRQFLAP